MSSFLKFKMKFDGEKCKDCQKIVLDVDDHPITVADFLLNKDESDPPLKEELELFGDSVRVITCNECHGLVKERLSRDSLFEWLCRHIDSSIKDSVTN